MEEKDKVKLISKEEIEKVINTLNEAEEKIGTGGKSFDLAKVKEVISSFEGCTPQTIVGVCNTAFLLLPADAIMTVIDTGKKVFTVKALGKLMGMIGKECPDCKCAAPEAPEE